ncbi:hypothetical protein ACHAWX_005360 [Stephanocyclus meneghinianus]
MDHETGPVGLDVEDKKEDKQNDTMELLLAQARQVQQEQMQKQRRQLEKEEEKAEKSANVDKIEAEKKQREREELMKQKKLEEEKIKEEQERKALELQMEQEEQRQLLALIGTEDAMDEDDAINDKKRFFDEEEEFFEFETQEEREERLARKRREERRKKLKVLETNDGISQVVDAPRNVAGVIASEMESAMPSVAADQSSPLQYFNHAANVQTDNLGEKTVGKADNSDDDSFDIFATDNPTPIPNQPKNTKARNTNIMRSNIAQECDDAEGYYKASIGEVITLPKKHHSSRIDNDGESDDDRFARFRVLGIIGKGVFSTVIKVIEETHTSNSSNGINDASAGREMAMKIIRNNEVMAKAAAKEMRILRMLCRPGEKKKRREDGKTDSNGGEEEDLDEKERRERENHNIVRLLEVDPTMASQDASLAIPPPEFRSHCVFLFEFLPYNLREVLSKFGKNVGITLTAVRSYARQLLSALGHLERHRIVHADLKPDNILVSANFSTVKLADFGSAFFETDHDNDPTPYLVSRFYRPPEVILGLEYDRMVDLWSTSVTLAELFTGSVLFPGSSNNDILSKFMDALGPFSHKMVRRHAASYAKMGLTPHFEVGITGGTYRFRRHDIDRVTGQPVIRMATVLSAKADARLAQVLLRASKVGSGSASERVDVLKFADFLNRCLALDPARRLSVRDALKHEFFMKKKKKDASKE